MKKAQINLLIKWSLIAIVVTVLPLLAFNVVSKASAISCKNSLQEIEGKFKEVSQELTNSGKIELALKRPCKIDTISIFDDSSSIQNSTIVNLTQQSPKRGNYGDNEKPNVFFFENKEIIYSFSMPNLKLSWPNYLCIDSRYDDIRLSFEIDNDRIKIKHVDNKLNCGPINVNQIPLDEILKNTLFGIGNSSLGELPDDIDTMQINVMNNAEISREIVCANENEAEIKITLRAKDGRKLKSAVYIELIDNKCSEEISAKNLQIYNYGISGIYEITNVSTKIINNSMIIWQFNDAYIGQLPVTLSYTVNKCIRDCRQELIKSVFYAKKVFNLDTDDEIAKITSLLPEPKMIEPVKSAVRKGEFDTAIKESIRLGDMIKDKDSKMLIGELIEEINGMKTDSERVD